MFKFGLCTRKLGSARLEWAPEEGMKQIFNRGGVLQGTVGQRQALSEFLVMVTLEMLVVVTVLAVSGRAVMGQ